MKTSSIDIVVYVARDNDPDDDHDASIDVARETLATLTPTHHEFYVSDTSIDDDCHIITFSRDL